MKDLKDWAAVQKVYRQTHSKRKTARILGISRNTVKKLLDAREPPIYKRSIYPSLIDPYREQIIEWRCEERYQFCGTRIYEELQRIGYTGSIGPVYRFLKKIDEDTEGHISSKATVRHESPPGDQAQFDWSEYDVMLGGSYQHVYCFSMILAASRKKAICFSLREDADAIYEAIQELFADLGGVTLELLIDNPKALVIENNPKSEDEIRYNPHALMLARHLGTELNACPCYWPRKKGKIERPFNYIEEHFIKGNEFATMEELNRRGKRFIDKWCDKKHTTTRRIPNQHYLMEERQALLPLPAKRLRFKKLQERIISPDSLISIQGSKYSVPVNYVGKRMFFRIVYGFRIEIYDRKEDLVLTRESSMSKGDVLRDQAHYEAIAKKVPTSIPQIRRDFTKLYRNGKAYLDAAGRKFDQPTHYARKIMAYQDIYEREILDALLGIAVKKDALDIKSFRSLLKEFNAGRLAIEAVPAETLTEEPVTRNEGDTEDALLIRDCSYYDENVISKEVG